MVRRFYGCCFENSCPILHLGGSLVSHGQISVGELTSLLMYTVYVGNGLQMLTYVHLTPLSDNVLVYTLSRSFFVSLPFTRFLHV